MAAKNSKQTVSAAYTQAVKAANSTPEQKATSKLVSQAIKAGIKVADIAAKFGSSPGAVYMMAKGIRAASPDRLATLEKMLGKAGSKAKHEVTAPSGRKVKVSIPDNDEPTPPRGPKGGKRMPLVIDVAAGETEAQAEARIRSAVESAVARATAQWVKIVENKLAQLDLFGADVAKLEQALVDGERKGLQLTPAARAEMLGAVAARKVRKA